MRRDAKRLAIASLKDGRILLRRASGIRTRCGDINARSRP
jgi:hypothetical protein